MNGDDVQKAILALAAVGGIGFALLGGASPANVPENVGLSPGDKATAVEVCNRPLTTITYVRTPFEFHYEAKYDVPGEPRYDLTWREQGTTVAVERLEGAKFDISAEQLTDDLWICIRQKSITIKDAPH